MSNHPHYVKSLESIDFLSRLMGLYQIYIKARCVYFSCETFHILMTTTLYLQWVWHHWQRGSNWDDIKAIHQYPSQGTSCCYKICYIIISVWYWYFRATGCWGATPPLFVPCQVSLNTLWGEENTWWPKSQRRCLGHVRAREHTRIYKGTMMLTSKSTAELQNIINTKEACEGWKCFFYLSIS